MVACVLWSTGHFDSVEEAERVFSIHFCRVVWSTGHALSPALVPDSGRSASPNFDHDQTIETKGLVSAAKTLGKNYLRV